MPRDKVWTGSKSSNSADQMIGNHVDKQVLTFSPQPNQKKEVFFFGLVSISDLMASSSPAWMNAFYGLLVFPRPSCARHVRLILLLLIFAFGREYDVRIEQDGPSDITAHSFSSQHFLF